MKLQLAEITANASLAAYDAEPRTGCSFNIDSFDRIEGAAFNGFVASNDDLVLLTFRGTELKMGSVEELIATATQWLTNFNVAQTTSNGHRVHQGFDRELDRFFVKLPEIVRDHGAATKPFIVTGHSAGGALATLAGRRLHESVVQVDGIYTYSSPRVGDRAFATSFPIPLYRFEYRDDIIPHVPFPPSLMGLLDTVIEDLYPLIDSLFPNLMKYAPKNVEYVHTGKLYFIDWDGDVLYNQTFGDFAETVLDALFSDDDEEEGDSRMIGMPLPKIVLDGARSMQTLANIREAMEKGVLSFIGDHHLDGPISVVKKLAGLQ